MGISTTTGIRPVISPLTIMKDWIADYICEYERTVRSIPVDEVFDLVERLRTARSESRTIFVCGNGGSAANASHFAVDLGKSASAGGARRFRVLSLNDNTPYITAIGNDYGYDDVFVEQLTNLARPDDILLCLSVSGDSPNVVKAMEWANKHGLVTVGLGSRKRGRLADLACFSILIDDDHYGRVEDAQMTICHLLCYAFVENG